MLNKFISFYIRWRLLINSLLKGYSLMYFTILRIQTWVHVISDKQGFLGPKIKIIKIFLHPQSRFSRFPKGIFQDKFLGAITNPGLGALKVHEDRAASCSGPHIRLVIQFFGRSWIRNKSLENSKAVCFKMYLSCN